MSNLTDLIFRIHATLERTISFITLLRDLLARSKKAARTDPNPPNPKTLF